jgi:uncharacterized membrane protein
MMWSMVASGIVLGVAAFRLRYNASTDSFEEGSKNLATGMGITLWLTGLYLFITGLSIGLKWQFTGHYNVLFGGAAALGGLVLIAVATAFYLGRGLQAASYFALAVGLYLIVDALAILNNNLTSDSTKSFLLFLAPAAALIFSPIATHINNKYVRWIFGIFAFLFTIAWLYFAYTVTSSHLTPPPPTTS